MASIVPTHLPFSPPSGEECVALGLAARYLLRAGTEAATRLLGRPRVDAEAELLASLSDCLLQGAALCDEVASGHQDASPPRMSTPSARFACSAPQIAYASRLASPAGPTRTSRVIGSSPVSGGARTGSLRHNMSRGPEAVEG